MEKNTHNGSTSAGEIHEGLLFIPDISGFTELVRSTDVLTGRQITYELLSAVISQNELQLNIAEVEGDAVLFYRYGKIPALHQLLHQYKMMARAFEIKCSELEDRFHVALPLSLKVIAHYGTMTEYSIGNFKKLYGHVLIEAHRLLKNSIESDRYLLLTDSALESTSMTVENELLQYGIVSNKLCEVYGAMRNICFTYFDFSTKNMLRQAA